MTFENISMAYICKVFEASSYLFPPSAGAVSLSRGVPPEAAVAFPNHGDDDSGRFVGFVGGDGKWMMCCWSGMVMDGVRYGLGHDYILSIF